MHKDFRSYLDYLETKGRLCRVKKEVNLRYEIAAGIRKVSDTAGPALLFENIKGYPGWKVAGGVYATQKLIALAIGAEDDEAKITQRYLEFDQKRVKYYINYAGRNHEYHWPEGIPGTTQQIIG